MRELWSKDEASFEGKYVKFTPVRCNPKPIQQPGPPVLIGSLDKNALKRVAKWADGWCPIGVPHGYLKNKLDELRRECDAVGRDFAKLDITAMGFVQGDRAAVQAASNNTRKPAHIDSWSACRTSSSPISTKRSSRASRRSTYR